MALLTLDDPVLHNQVAYAILLLSPVVFLILTYASPSTYGKLYSSRTNWFGPLVSAKWAWMLFESPSWIWVLVSLNITTTSTDDLVFQLPNGLLLIWFFLHYIHRSLVYPCHMSPQSKFPIGLMIFTVPYTCANGYLQTLALCRFQVFPIDHFYSLQFLIGLILMLAGFTLGFVSDRALLRLKRTTGQYHIPRGGFFELVSMPHYFGEMVEWFGFCIASDFSLASISFLVWTACNLIPRALAQHQWYHDKFKEDYPRDRMAVIPFVL